MKKWLALCLLGLSGCGAELERSSEVETLRVLGAESGPYYAKRQLQIIQPLFRIRTTDL